MFDKEAIEALAEAQSIGAAAQAVSAAALQGSAVALPERFKLHDFEHFAPQRRRARGKMTTESVGDFAAYVKEHAERGAVVFGRRLVGGVQVPADVWHRGARLEARFGRQRYEYVAEAMRFKGLQEL